LNFSGNFSGAIPTSIRYNTKLTALSIHSTNLTGIIPFEICEVISLEIIWLVKNELQGSIPSCIGQLQNLEWFNVGDNQMSGIVPDGLGLCTGLKEIDLNMFPTEGHTNEFTGSIPASFNNLTSLKIIYWNVETLEGPLPNLSSLVSLEKCRFIPSKLCLPTNYTIPALVKEFEWNCDFNVLPDCDKQKEHEIDCFFLKSWLPNIFTEEQGCCENDMLNDALKCEGRGDGNIVTLNLAGLGIQGQFPDIPQGTFKDLLVLDLSNNAIAGPFPATINRFVNLQELNLDGNSMTGSIPKEIGDMIELIILNLENNQLEGQLPLSLVNLIQLKRLYLRYNARLTGLVPTIEGLFILKITGTDCIFFIILTFIEFDTYKQVVETTAA
jgi:Leucine-rich repeat (LRR) protein